jgi:hypothetical protein
MDIENFTNVLEKKEPKKRAKTYKYKDVFDNPRYPNKKITKVKSKKD